MRPRTACAGQSIDGEAFSRAELAIADGEPGFRGRGLPGNDKRDHPAQEMPEKHDHDQHFIGTVRIEPVAMSFILRVYEVLASHSALVYDALTHRLREHRINPAGDIAFP